MFRLTGTERDGALDNTIIAHEWGHYIHHRLADCGQQQCSAMSEGWGDFIALHTIARDGDNLNGTYALATYATSAFDPNSAFRHPPCAVLRRRHEKRVHLQAHFGRRRAAAGSDAAGRAELRGPNAGEIWTTMLWEVRGAQKARSAGETFDDVRRRMADHVVAGSDGAARCNLYRTAGRHSQRRGSA